jgi:hypothetical protein
VAQPNSGMESPRRRLFVSERGLSEDQESCIGGRPLRVRCGRFHRWMQMPPDWSTRALRQDQHPLAGRTQREPHKHLVADHPAAGPAGAGMTSVEPGAPSNTQGSGMPRCRQVAGLQRWSAVNHRLRSLFACGEGDFLLPEPARSATLGSKLPGIR